MLGGYEPTRNCTPIDAARAAAAPCFPYCRARASLSIFGRNETTADRTAEIASASMSFRHFRLLLLARLTNGHSYSPPRGCQMLTCMEAAFKNSGLSHYPAPFQPRCY